jgi:hypothetical protein
MDDDDDDDDKYDKFSAPVNDKIIVIAYDCSPHDNRDIDNLLEFRRAVSGLVHHLVHHRRSDT